MNNFGITSATIYEPTSATQRSDDREMIKNAMAHHYAENDFTQSVQTGRKTAPMWNYVFGDGTHPSKKRTWVGQLIHKLIPSF